MCESAGHQPQFSVGWVHSSTGALLCEDETKLSTPVGPGQVNPSCPARSEWTREAWTTYPPTTMYQPQCKSTTHQVPQPQHKGSVHLLASARFTHGGRKMQLDPKWRQMPTMETLRSWGTTLRHTLQFLLSKDSNKLLKRDKKIKDRNLFIYLYIQRILIQEGCYWTGAWQCRRKSLYWISPHKRPCVKIWWTDLGLNPSQKTCPTPLLTKWGS